MNCEIFKNSFFYRTHPVAASDAPLVLAPYPTEVSNFFKKFSFFFILIIITEHWHHFHDSSLHFRHQALS